MSSQDRRSLEMFFSSPCNAGSGTARSRSPLGRVHNSGKQHVNVVFNQNFQMNLQYVQAFDVLTPSTYRRQALSLSIRFQLVPLMEGTALQDLSH